MSERRRYFGVAYGLEPETERPAWVARVRAPGLIPASRGHRRRAEMLYPRRDESDFDFDFRGDCVEKESGTKYILATHDCLDGAVEGIEFYTERGDFLLCMQRADWVPPVRSTTMATRIITGALPGPPAPSAQEIF